MTKITAKTIAAMPQCLRLDDLIVAPPPKSLPALMTALEPCLADPDINVWQCERPQDLFLELDTRASELVDADPKPEWYGKLPLSVRQHLANHERIHGRMDDEIFIIYHVPFSNIQYTILEGGLFEDVARVFGLHRLHNVSQLGFLCIPQSPAAEHQVMVTQFPHTRFEHVMSVAVIARLMAHNVGLTVNETTHLVVAALTHDTLTPAGGDTVKRLDMEAFDEDKHYPELFSLPGWKALAEKWSLSEELLKHTVLGKGKLGKLLDYADKMIYTATDIRNLLERLPFSSPDFTPSDGARVVKEIVDESPRFCDVWDSVECRGEEIAFNDPDRLATFLRARTLMFKYVYFDIDAGRFEMMYVQRYLKPMYEAGIITREWLLEHGDRDLIRKLEEFMGRPIHHHVFGDSEDLVVEEFATEAQATERIEELFSGATKYFHIDHFGAKIKPALHLPVFNAENRAVPFKDEHPDLAADIERLAEMTKRYRLYAFITR